MSTEETNATMFDLAIEIERTMQHFYNRLSKQFVHAPEISRFWDGMRKDEIYHERTLERIRGSLHPERLTSIADRSMLRLAKSLVNDSTDQRLNTLETLDDAYDLAHELENSEFNTVFEFIVKAFITHPETQKFALKEIDVHLRKLIDFPQTFGDLNWRKNVRVNGGNGRSAG